jgi:ribosome biogenesis GTPase A
MLMSSYYQVAQKVAQQADLILLVVDARQGIATDNPLVHELARGKKLLYVINKIDLVDERVWKALKRELKPCVAVSAKDHLGTMMLLRRINEIARGEDVVVGVLGYPNTGKSSLINALKGKGSTSTSPQAGHTKAVQKIRVSEKVVLLDAPGIIPRDDRDDKELHETHAFLGTVDVHKLKEPDIALARLMQEYPGMVERFFAVPVSDDYDATIEAIALKKNLVLPGGAPDVVRASRAILRDFQTGKIKDKRD